MYETIHSFIENILDYAIVAIEVIGALIILFYTVRALISLLQKQHHQYRGFLTTGITTGLNFLLASEVLKTIGEASWSDIGMVCAILLMRAGMTLLVHWESKMEHPAAEPKK
ncbi:MAG: DUF1622 domain-containing protein [Clostridia bacterium]|nr:DUF1622 domain-containing protein [Clostridia bacterium]